MKLDVLHRRILIDARAAHDALQSVLPVVMPKKYQHRKINVSAFVNRINRVTKDLNIHNYVILNSKAPEERITFSGLWLPETDLPWKNSDADVRVEWNVHPSSRRIEFTYQSWRRFRFGYWGFLMHELLHRHQIDRRPSQDARSYRPEAAVQSIREEQEYLGDYDEIEAHAHDVAIEMMLLSPHASFTKALDVMRQQPPHYATTYNVYMQTFAGSPNHAATKVFSKKIKSWFALVKAEQAFYQSLQLEASWDA